MNKEVVDKFLESVYTVKSDRRAIHIIFGFAMDLLDGLPLQQIDDNMEKFGGPRVLGVEAKTPDYESIDEVLRRADFNRLNTTRICTFAIIAFWAKKHSKERPAFLERARRKLLETESEEKVHRLLVGLE